MNLIRVLMAVALLCAGGPAQAAEFAARVIAVLDGDTVLVLREGRKIKVRMANIDAPEKDQAFGKQARDSLLEMVDKRQVQIDSQAIDQYGRMVGLISVDGRNVNQEQVRRGMAWEYSHYHADKTYIGLQSDARQARRGLWSQGSPQAPWEWRKSHPSVDDGSHAAATSKSVTGDAPGCGSKTRCAEMTSCEEARHYLTQCGIKTLDGNGDGVPCEKLCTTAIHR